MKKLSKAQKTAFVESFNNSNATRLSDVYTTTVSYNKQMAYWRVYDIHKADVNRNSVMKIISHNCQFFTAAWETVNPETGALMLHVETANRTYIFDI